MLGGISTEVSESDIKSETGAQYVRRVVKRDSGKQIMTESVVLNYLDALLILSALVPEV